MTGIGAGAVELVPSVLAFFTDPEVEASFLLWVLRPWANLRATLASISAIKENQHGSEMEQEEGEAKKKEEKKERERYRQG